MYLFVFLVAWAVTIGLVLPVLLSILSLQRCDCPTCQDRRLRQLFRRNPLSQTLKRSSVPSAGPTARKHSG
jgi:hypothetical protein